MKNDTMPITAINLQDICSYKLVKIYCTNLYMSTNTLKVIWQLTSFTGGERPHVPLCALFKAQGAPY
jgi:hypothetical protein